MKTLHIPHFLFYKNKILFTIFYKLFYNNIQFDSPFFQKCLLHASCYDKIFSSLELKMWVSLHRELCCTSCPPPCWLQTCVQRLYNGSTPSMASQGVLGYLPLKLSPLLEPLPLSFHSCLQVTWISHMELDVHLQNWFMATEYTYGCHI